MSLKPKEYVRAIGFDPETCQSVVYEGTQLDLINLRLASLGQPVAGDEEGNYPFSEVGRTLVAQYRARARYLEDIRPPADERIEAFIARYLGDLKDKPVSRLPGRTFALPQHGVARVLSLPASGDKYHSELVDSYRLANGVLHNPVKDRRTTEGVFHIAEGGLPIPGDKKAVPKRTFARLLRAALEPPDSLMELQLTANQEKKARVWVSLLLRPVVAPEIPGFMNEQRMETRFFAPGNLVSNLDFVESIFGNAGDPFLPENDAGMDFDHWSGHTGCVILAPHLIRVTKKELGLPHVSEATERQKRDGMCWESEDEKYNDGGAFKVTARDADGVVVTLIADNYFGYCKKEVKTQISFAANLMGLAEEEHAGGALAFASYDLGEDFRLTDVMSEEGYTLDDLLRREGHHIKMMPEGHGVDTVYPEIIYIPEGAHFSLGDQRISWMRGGEEKSVKLLAERVYILPMGYRVELKKPAVGRRWRLIGTSPEPTLCHKPCTVSGGGKSEISKSIADAIIHAPFYVKDFKQDFDAVESILKRDYRDRFRDPARRREKGREILSPERTLGSVVKLFTPSPDFTDEHNEFIESIPPHIKELVLIVKRFYKQDWGDNWRSRFSVDVINGSPGHELKYRSSKVVASYLRVGYESDDSWRVFSLRKDFAPAAKIQAEDDITASITVPHEVLGGVSAPLAEQHPSLKVVFNCENRLFQRPDDAIVRGYDKKTEEDIARAGSFVSNFQPLTHEEAQEMVEDAVRFDYFTDPMKQRIRSFVEHPEQFPEYVVSSSNPRLVDGKPSKNPRYLQTVSTLEFPRDPYVAEIGNRLLHRMEKDVPATFTVSAVLPGRRNNPPEGAIRNLAVFNPVHYLPLPEAFMEFVSSMTGKSPSTTGAGSEGGLTKGPFNMLQPVVDLNNALVSAILTGYKPFITAAGYVGPKFRVDHDISLLVPEVWCRMRLHERNPDWLIENGFLDPMEDFEYEGETVPASLLGYRINEAFVAYFMGRIFANPSILFAENMLRPEQQGMEDFVDGMKNIMETHRRVAGHYFEDGSIDLACPPLKALLHIMAHGEWEGRGYKDPEVRALFTRESLLESDWYGERLDRQQKYFRAFWEARASYLESVQLDDDARDLAKARIDRFLKECAAEEGRKRWRGTIGRDPFC